MPPITKDFVHDNSVDANNSTIAPRTALPFSFVLGLVILVLVCRCWERLTEVALWAEDGSLFLKEAYTLGWKALFSPFQGYYHTVPRLIAWIASPLPALWIPTFTTCFSLFIVALVFARFSKSDFGHLVPSDGVRALGCIGLAFTCGMHETLGNLANLHWYLSFYLALMGMRAFPSRISPYEFGFICLAIASCGEAIAYAPLFLARAFLHRISRKDDLGVLLMMTIFAGLNYFARDTAIEEQQALGLSIIFTGIQHSWINHFLLQPLLGDQLTWYLGKHVDWAFWLVTLLLSFFLVQYLRFANRSQWLVFIAALCCLCVPAMSWFVRSGHIRYFSPMARDPELSFMRYSAMVSPLAFIFLWQVVSHMGGKWRATTANLFVILYIGLAWYRFELGTYWENGPKWKDSIANLKVDSCEGQVYIAIQPYGWYTHFPKSKFCTSSRRNASR